VKALRSDVDGMIDVGSGELSEADDMARMLGVTVNVPPHSLHPVVARTYETANLLRSVA
jgi:hypothetical protein